MADLAVFVALIPAHLAFVPFTTAVRVNTLPPLFAHAPLAFEFISCWGEGPCGVALVNDVHARQVIAPTSV